MTFSSPSPRLDTPYTPQHDGSIREAVALFMSSEDLQAAIRDLEGSAFPRQDISVMGSEPGLESVFGNTALMPPQAMDSNLTPREAPSRPEEQVIGAAAMVGIPAYVGAMALALAAGAVTFPATVAAAVLGGLGGGAFGAVLSKLLGDKYSQNIEDQLSKGGLLLWVRTPDVEKEQLALKIMRSHGGREAHVHDIE